MHICFLTSEFPKPGYSHGGVGTFIRNLGIALVNNGFRVSVVGPNYNDEFEFEVLQGIHVYRTRRFDKTRGITWLRRARSINKVIEQIHRENPVNIIEGTELSLAFIDKIPGIKYVIRMNGGHHFFSFATGEKLSKWKSFQEKRSFNKADHLISVSKYTAESTKSLLGLKDRHIQIIPNPIDADLFKPNHDKSVISNKLLFVGTVCEKKGVRQLVMAMPKILEKFPEASLEIVGRDWIDPKTKSSYTEYLKSFIYSEISNKIQISGPVDLVQIPGKIAESEICVYPSHMEALPLAWLEVLAMGKPFVASKTGPGPEVVIHGETGLLADCYSPDDIADQVIYMLENKPKAQDMGKNARLDILKRFDVKVLVKENINYYQSLI
ncbi:glycosyltransferase family 1 protein [Algoriphagus kandeliae]|uniref:Glycosyltransferase family 1 protein n=1 Tax=Algoriphagus kandeliae TaxID=2562278 RepID=A0A4Y9QYP6_9BACT|nr:glycosyltransferase family 4 protein [Algoriphagus kandeliae]TFV97217.1 glycosyltransferase family 1 protein [Algoriphagus kandeliae]